jgi:hypothetical protein
MERRAGRVCGGAFGGVRNALHSPLDGGIPIILIRGLGVALHYLVHVDVPPAAGRIIRDHEARSAPLKLFDVPAGPYEELAIAPSGGSHRKIIDEKVYAEISHIASTRDEEIDPIPIYSELPRSEHTGRGITADVTIHQSASAESANELLICERPPRGTGPKRGSTNLPTVIGISFEISNQDFGPLANKQSSQTNT